MASRDGRRTISLRLTPRAEDMARSLKADTGMTQQAAVERLIEFVAEVDPRLRTAILSPHREVRCACAIHLLRQLAGQETPAPSLAHFEQVMHEILPKARSAAELAHVPRRAKRDKKPT